MIPCYVRELLENSAVPAKLQAFISSVEAQRNKKISAADADGLVAAAQEIIARLQN